MDLINKACSACKDPRKKGETYYKVIDTLESTAESAAEWVCDCCYERSHMAAINISITDSDLESEYLIHELESIVENGSVPC